MTRTIYLVSTGSYSDYRVELAFEINELAKAYCERENPFRQYSELYVETLELHDQLPEPGTRIFQMYTRVNPDRTIRDSSTDNYTLGNPMEVSWEPENGLEVDIRTVADGDLFGVIAISVRGTDWDEVKTRHDQLVDHALTARNTNQP